MRNGRFWSRLFRRDPGLAVRPGGRGAQSWTDCFTFYAVRSGLPWRMLPRDFPPVMTHETTVNLIANGTLTLLRYRKWLERRVSRRGLPVLPLRA